MIADIGPRPSTSHSISRFLDMGDYRPGNCEWADRTTQGAERKGHSAMLAYRAARAAGFVWNEPVELPIAA